MTHVAPADESGIRTSDPIERRLDMRHRTLALSAVMLFGVCTAAAGISVLPLSEEELTRRATIIVTGDVIDVHSAFNEAGTSIYTYVDVRVSRSLKPGFEGETVTLRQLGGTVGDRTQTVPGAPAYEPGDEVLLFAGPLGETGYYGVLGIFYGKYDITTDPATGRRTVRGASFGITHYDPESLRPLPVRERPERVDLDDFLAEIEGYLSEN
jgi:hypothetical protein